MRINAYRGSHVLMHLLSYFSWARPVICRQPGSPLCSSACLSMAFAYCFCLQAARQPILILLTSPPSAFRFSVFSSTHVRGLPGSPCSSSTNSRLLSPLPHTSHCPLPLFH